MVGAVVFGVLALAGANGPLWWSDAAPRAGEPYVAISWSGQGDFWCSGLIGRQRVTTTAYPLNDLATTVCVLQIPKGTAGKKLTVAWEISSRDGNLFTNALGFVRPKVIRR